MQVPAEPLLTHVKGDEHTLPQLAQFWFVPNGVQVWLQHPWPVEQSPDTLHPPAASQVPFVLQDPERQTTGPLLPVQGPSPFK
jgi:hypothetical protein